MSPARSRAFTIVELVIVVCVLGVLLAIAIPAFAGAKRRASAQACAENRAKFDQAKLMWMMDNAKTHAAPVYFKDLLPEYIPTPPVCPDHGVYALNGLESDTTCSVHKGEQS